jgi:hypothetical protein
MEDIRIIYDYNISKNKVEYNFLKNILKNSIEFIYVDSHFYYLNNKLQNFIVQPKYKINIFIDIVSEDQIEKLPSDYNILIINEEYLLNNNLLRRETFKNKPLKILDDYIHYYICLTNYSFNLILDKVNKNKVILLNGLITKQNNNNLYSINKVLKLEIKYIYYLVDEYSKQDNIILLKTWIKYYLDRKEILIIHIKHKREDIVKLMLDLLNTYYYYEDNIYFYNNIIFYYNDKYTKFYEKKIYCNFINHSYFDLVIRIQNSILNNQYIITKYNDVSYELLNNNSIYFNQFNEDEIKVSLDNLFSMNNKKIKKHIKNNIQNINKSYLKRIKIFNKFNLINNII